MKISAELVAKRFHNHHIFKNVSLQFEAPNCYALLGANGSGKSTLLRIIAGIQSPTKGKVIHSLDEKEIAPEDCFRNISFCAPGMDLVEEMTLKEFLTFHFGFKKMLAGFTIDKIIELTGLKNVENKFIGDYSSGMKQRVKLAQAIFSDTPALFLDEPCTNLDQKGVDQYRNWVMEYGKNRLVIIASNELREYDFCNNHIEMESLK